MLKTKHPCRTALITGSFTPSSTPTLLTKVTLGTNLVFSSLPSGIMSQTVLQTFPPFTYFETWTKTSDPHFPTSCPRATRRKSKHSGWAYLWIPSFRQKNMIRFHFKPLKSGKLYFTWLNLGSNNIAWGGWWVLFKELSLPQNTDYISLLHLKRRGTPSLAAFSLKDSCEMCYSMVIDLFPKPWGEIQFSRTFPEESVFFFPFISVFLRFRAN